MYRTPHVHVHVPPPPAGLPLHAEATAVCAPTSPPLPLPPPPPHLQGYGSFPEHVQASAVFQAVFAVRRLSLRLLLLLLLHDC